MDLSKRQDDEYLVQRDFILRIQSRLRNFRWNGEVANFSCPVCGDSKKDLCKARGYLYSKSRQFFFFCHNCGFSSSFQKFLSQVDNTLYIDYVKAMYMKDKPKPFVRKKAVEREPVSLKSAITIASLDENHPAKQYILNRKIPEFYHDRMYYASNFRKWMQTFVRTAVKYHSDERIIIPFFDGKGEVSYVQARALNGNSKLRYITHKVDPNAPKIFNYDQVVTTKKIFIVEGVFDSMFIPNSIAVAGSDVPKILDKLNYDFVYVPDREPHNPEIVKNISRLIDRGFKVVLLPDLRGKDINEYILNGYTVQHILKLFDSHTFTGLDAQFQLKMWKTI